MDLMNGSQCCKILKNLMNEEKLNEFPIYSTGNFTKDQIMEYKKNFGFDGFLSSPLNIAEVGKIDIWYKSG